MTIYALSTGPGVAGVAIIRISGAEASEVIKRLIKGRITPTKISYPSKNKQYQHF